MAKDFNKLVNEVEYLVNNFTSFAEDIANDYPRQAIKALVQDKANETLNKWNDLLEKLSDDEYEQASKANKLDLKVVASLTGGRYLVNIRPEVEPSSTGGAKMEQLLNPYFKDLSNLAGAAATKAYKSGNTSFNILIDKHLKFS